MKTNLAPLYEVKLIVDGKKHLYQIGTDDTWRPGVTTVMSAGMPKPALVPWAVKCVSDNVLEALTARNGTPLTTEDIAKICAESKNIYKSKSSAAADVGTRVHKAVDEIIHGRQPEITDDIRPAVEGFLKWKDQEGIEFEMGDTKVGSKLFGYGGSLDFMGFKRGEPVIFDLKTTKKRRDKPHGIYDEYGVQLSAYWQAFKETYGLPIKSVYALWVNKEKPEFQAVKVTNVEKCFEGFLACLKLYELSKFQLFDDVIKGEHHEAA